jgi:hypothetical protein
VVVWVQAPAPLQAPTLVCTPLAHDPLPHAFEVPGKVHAVGFTPSQNALQVPVPAHAARRPPDVWAAPLTATQVPTLPVTSHAWH